MCALQDPCSNSVIMGYAVCTYILQNCVLTTASHSIIPRPSLQLLIHPVDSGFRQLLAYRYVPIVLICIKSGFSHWPTCSLSGFIKTATVMCLRTSCDSYTPLLFMFLIPAGLTAPDLSFQEKLTT